MSKIKSCLIVMLITALVISTSGICALADNPNVVGTGECGENATWSLDDQGVLTISGTGDITDWEEGNEPYNCVIPGTSDNYPITRLVIENGITGIGYQMFSHWDSLTGDLTIPDSVTCIEDEAFWDCTGFDGNLIIGDSVTDICSFAFCNCYGFKTVKLGKSVKKISTSAFEDCSGLTGTLVIPESLEELYANAFTGCDSLGKVIFTGDAPDLCTIDPVFPSEVNVYYCPEKEYWNDTTEEWMCHECFPLYDLSEDVSRIITFSDKVPNKDRARILEFAKNISVSKSSSAALYEDKIKILNRMIPEAELPNNLTWDEIMQDPTYGFAVKVQTIVKVTDSDLDNEKNPYVEYSLTPILSIKFTVEGEDIKRSTELYPGDFSTIPITITVPLGNAFAPKTIEHISKDGQEIYEVFTANGSKTFTFDPVNRTVSIQIKHFSNIRINGQPKAAAVDTGDSNDIELYSALVLVSLVGICLTNRRRKCN